eukprot:Nk52_evm1s16 gene=Nk52_evmTU1s16
MTKENTNSTVISGGPENSIRASRGPEVPIFNVYHTRYSNEYVDRKRKCAPMDVVEKSKTGYVSNIRPALGYHPSMDEEDNPTFLELPDSYKTVYQNSHRASKGPNGKEEMPVISGKRLDHEKYQLEADCFVRNPKLFNENRPKPFLHKIQPKNPIDLENDGKGPKRFNSEYQVEYVEKNLMREQRNQGEECGQKISTGYTNDCNDFDTITGDSKYPAALCHFTSEQEKISTNTDTYRCPQAQTLPSRFPSIVQNGSTQTGFSLYSVKPRYQKADGKIYTDKKQVHPSRLVRLRRMAPAEYMNYMHPERTSVTTNDFRQPEQYDRLFSLSLHEIGRKEDTGFINNAEERDPFQILADASNNISDKGSGSAPRDVNSSRSAGSGELLDIEWDALTEYNDKYVDMNPKYKMGFQKDVFVVDGGYSRGTLTKIHDKGKTCQQMIQEMNPSVGRIMRLQDPFFAEENPIYQ